MDSSKLAYTLDEFAETVSLSKAQIRKHIEGTVDPVLVPSYSGTKPLSIAERTAAPKTLSSVAVAAASYVAAVSGGTNQPTARGSTP